MIESGSSWKPGTSEPTVETIEAHLRSTLTFELPDNLEPYDDLIDDHGLDSIQFVEILVAVEELAGITPDLDEVPALRTIADLVDYYWLCLRGETAPIELDRLGHLGTSSARSLKPREHRDQYARNVEPSDYEFLYRLALDAGHAWNWHGGSASVDSFAESLWTGVNLQYLLTQPDGSPAGLASVYDGNLFHRHANIRMYVAQTARKSGFPFRGGRRTH